MGINPTRNPTATDATLPSLRHTGSKIRGKRK